MDKRALQLESRFSLPPNSLGYCGQNTAAAKFKICIIDGQCDDVGQEVTKFIVLHPYLKTLAEITGLPMLSYPIIESYWIGNELLKQAKPQHYNLLLDNFAKQGVPDFFVEELRMKQPKIFIPNHLFQVLHIGVGRASGAVPFNMRTINNCMIRWGKINKIKENKAVIQLHSLMKTKQHQQYSLNMIEEKVPFNSKLVPRLKVGDNVIVHWNMVIKVITKDEENKLAFWTNEVITHLN